MGINREIRYITAGDSNSVSQAFYNNCLADSMPAQTSFFSFLKPMYYTYGGTLDYYGQDPYAIFTNLVRPPIRFIFSANTSSLSGDSYFIHEIYRLDYDTFKLYSDNQIDTPVNLTNKSDSSNNSTGNNLVGKNASSKGFESSEKIKTGNNRIIQPEKFFGGELTNSDKSTIQNFLSNPLIIITASTSGITGNVYDLFIEQYVKRLGNYKTELFLDKSQYFVNTKLVFYKNLNKNYEDFYNNNFGAAAIPSQWNDSLKIISTNNSKYTIDSGMFTGIDVIGNYFSYFIVPDKPKVEYPVAEGQLSTFTPEFRWSNGDSADSFLIRISYNTGDTGFTGTVYNYPVEKSEKNSKTSTSVTKGSFDEISTTKTLYTFQISVKSNKSFIWQIGNSREFIDIFDVRRNVVTFSEYYAAISQSEPIKTYVVSESDSKISSEISGLRTPPSLDYESEISEYILSGTVSGNLTVTGATMTLTYPNSSFITTVTDLNGNYLFSSLESGSYILTTNYRGYQQDIRAINLTGDTSENFSLKLLWGNNFDIWGELGASLFS